MSIQAVNQNTAQATGQSATSSSGRAAAAPAPASSTSASSTKGASSSTPASSYSVSISNAARAMLAEATETSVQTAQEAAKGDQQARRLLAHEAAAKVH